MIDQDFDGFASEVRRLATVFRLRASPVELTQITQAYFKAFKRRPLGEVIGGADNWIAAGDRFPKPTQWLSEMPHGGRRQLLALTRDESDEWLLAERRRWEDSPCHCVLCVAAVVTHHPLRFVPDFEEDGREARALLGDRVITRGHWAHGDELVRYYAAKAECIAKWKAAFPANTERERRMSIDDRLTSIFDRKRATGERPDSDFVQIGRDREVGEDDD